MRRRKAPDRFRGTPGARAGLRLAVLACAGLLVSSCAAAGGAAGAAGGSDPVTGSPSASPSLSPSSAAAAGGQQAAPDAPAARSTHPVTTVVVSDEPAVAAAGQSAAGAWPGAVAQRLAAAGTPLELQVVADPAAGFAADAPTDPSFTALVLQHVAPDTQLVVFSETRFGSAAASAVSQGAKEAFAAVERQAPDALIVVVAPWPSSADLPAPGPEIRAAVQTAAQGAEVTVTYVDPVTEGWPTGADQQQIAELLSRDITPVVTSLASSGAFD
jgi:hypothetical protein